MLCNGFEMTSPHLGGPFGPDPLAVQSGDAHYASQTPV
jgi:hypothetical protein